MKHPFVFAAVAAVSITAFVSSCEKSPVYRLQSRTPHRVEFVKRDLGGIQIGANLPDSVKAVDLGLSVKWADINLGAASAIETGDYYSWGEIQPSGNTTWENYEFNDFHPDDPGTLYITRYCFDLYGESQDLAEGGVSLDINDDAAYVQWGEGWRMPTAEEAEELVSECSWSYDSDDKLYTVTGPNGNSIIIAESKAQVGTGIADNTSSLHGGLWTSTLCTVASPYAYELIPGTGVDSMADRAFGLHVRPVHK